MTKHARVLIALLCAVGLVAGCGSGSDTASGSDSVTRTVSTVQGEVSIPTDPERVVLLNNSLAGYLYDLNVPVVAMTTEYAGQPSEPYPAWAEDFREDGTEFLEWSDTGFNIEKIIAFKPDLIIGGGLGFPFKLGTDAYDKLKRIAPTVLVDNTLVSWNQQFKFLATDVFDQPDVYRDAVRRYDNRIAEVKAAITPPPGPVSFVSMTGAGKAYVLIEDRGVPAEFAKLGIEPAPIFATGEFEPYTAGGDSFEVVPELLGRTLIQPTIFVIGFHTDAITAEELERDPVWAALPAFRGDHAYDLPYWVQRPDFDRAMATLDHVEGMFGR